MLTASIDDFFAFLAACYELTSVLCFSCFIFLLFVANNFSSFLYFFFFLFYLLGTNFFVS